MRYRDEFAELIKKTGFGFLIALLPSMFFAWKVSGEFGINLFINFFVIELFIGSLAAIVLCATSGSLSMLSSSAVGLLTSMVSTAFSGFGGSAIGIAFGVIKLFVCLAISAFIAVYLIVSFPLTLIYMGIMALIEKKTGAINDTLANVLDIIVPIIAAVISIAILFAIFGDESDSRAKSQEVAKTQVEEQVVNNAVIDNDEEGKDEKEIAKDEEITFEEQADENEFETIEETESPESASAEDSEADAITTLGSGDYTVCIVGINDNKMSFYINKGIESNEDEVITLKINEEADISLVNTAVSLDGQSGYTYQDLEDLWNASQELDDYWHGVDCNGENFSILALVDIAVYRDGIDKIVQHAINM